MPFYGIFMLFECFNLQSEFYFFDEILMGICWSFKLFATFLAHWRGCKNSFPTVFKVFYAVLKRKFSFFVENDDYWRKIGVGSFSTVKEWAEEVPVVPSTGPLYFWCRIAKMCFLSFSASVLTGTALFLFENDIKYWKRQFLGYIRCLKI